MQGRMLICLVCYFLLLPLADAETVTDDTGASITIAKPARRIVSLAPDLTEIVFAIGAKEQLVGVIAGSDYPEAVRKLPEVGNYSGLNLEQIIALKPDLIISWGNNFARQLALFEELHIPVYHTFPKQLADIAKTMLNLGKLTEHAEVARLQAKIFTDQLTLLHDQYGHRKPVRVFYQIGNYALFTINKDSWINQAIQLCGGENVFAEATLSVPEINAEALLRAKPDLIISDTADKNWKHTWQKWPHLTAVKNDLLFSVHADWIDRAGPRLPAGVQELCHFIDKARQKLLK